MASINSSLNNIKSIPFVCSNGWMGEDDDTYIDQNLSSFSFPIHLNLFDLLQSYSYLCATKPALTVSFKSRSSGNILYIRVGMQL